VDRKHLEGS